MSVDIEGLEGAETIGEIVDRLVGRQVGKLFPPEFRPGFGQNPHQPHTHAHARARRRPGAGSIRRGDGRDHGDLRRIVVAFPGETFAEIRARTEKKGTSFAEQVRTLVE
jgi:hypothetical protein